MGRELIVKDMHTILEHGETLESAKEAREGIITDLTYRLIALSASSPHDVEDFTGNVIPWVEYVPRAVTEILEDMDNAMYTLSIVCHALECPGDIIQGVDDD